MGRKKAEEVRDLEIIPFQVLAVSSRTNVISALSVLKYFLTMPKNTFPGPAKLKLLCSHFFSFMQITIIKSIIARDLLMMVDG